MKYYWSLFFLLIGFSLLLKGCAGRPGIIDLYGELTPGEIIENIRQRAQSIKTIKARAKVSLQTLEGEAEGAMNLVFDVDGKLLIRFRGPFGVGGFTIRWTGPFNSEASATIELYIPTHKCVYILDPSKNDLSSITGFNFDVIDIVNTFIRPLEGVDRTWHSEIRNEKLLFSKRSGLITKRIWIGGNPPAPVKYETFDYRGSPIYRKSLTGQHSIDGIIFPSKMRIVAISEIIQVRFYSITVNSHINDKSFEISVPDDVIRKNWGIFRNKNSM